MPPFPKEVARRAWRRIQDRRGAAKNRKGIAYQAAFDYLLGLEDNKLLRVENLTQKEISALTDLIACIDSRNSQDYP